MGEEGDLVGEFSGNCLQYTKIGQSSLSGARGIP